MEMPIATVPITMVTAGLPRSGWNTVRKNARPTTAMTMKRREIGEGARESSLRVGERGGADQRADDRELAGGEVHHARRLVGQLEAERDHGIDAADRERADQELEELRHVRQAAPGRS